LIDLKKIEYLSENALALSI